MKTIKHKKLLFILMVFTTITVLVGCSNRVKPVESTKTDFDIEDAEQILKNVWKPVFEMTTDDLITEPQVRVSTVEEFYVAMGLVNMSEQMKHSIFESIVDFGDDGQPIRDSDGNFYYGEGMIKAFIPTIYSQGAKITKAYIQRNQYKEEYAHMNATFLAIEVASDGQVESKGIDYTRTNIFEMNDDEEWVLTQVEGTICIAWERK